MSVPGSAGVLQVPLDRRVSGLAARQHGVFARDQLASLGATKDMIRHRLLIGRWDQITRDVFRLAGSQDSWLQRLIAACLAWGPGAVISHLAAAALWSLAGFEKGQVELTVPRRRRRPAPGVIHRNALGSADVTRVGAIPVTTVARTLIDLAAVVPEERVEEALDDALRRQMVSIGRLRTCLGRLPANRPGAGPMRRLLDAREGLEAVPQSVFETRMLRLMKRAGLPTPVLQYEIRSGSRRMFVDFAFPEHRVGVEADGYVPHSGRRQWDHDRARGNALTLLGWRILHVTWTALCRQPETVIDSIRRALLVGESG